MTIRGMWVLAMALILCACGGGPAAPSPTDTGDGITIFADPRFRGVSTILLADVEDLDDLVTGCYKNGTFGFPHQLRRLHFVYPDTGRPKGHGL